MTTFHIHAARGLSKRDVEKLVAALDPQPDIASSVRALPARLLASTPVVEPELMRQVVATPAPPVAGPPQPIAESRHTLVAPIAPKRYLIRLTVSEDTYGTLERWRALMRHQVPDGDPAAIVDRALSLLLTHVERTKVAATERKRAERPPTGSSRSRRIQAAVRREVWARDEGRCAFVSGDTRCDETGFLEFHHVIPYGAGGPGTVENIQLRCRAHNAYQAARDFGDWHLRSATRPE